MCDAHKIPGTCFPNICWCCQPGQVINRERVHKVSATCVGSRKSAERITQPAPGVAGNLLSHRGFSAYDSRSGKRERRAKKRFRRCSFFRALQLPLSRQRSRQPDVVARAINSPRPTVQIILSGIVNLAIIAALFVRDCDRSGEMIEKSACIAQGRLLTTGQPGEGRIVEFGRE